VFEYDAAGVRVSKTVIISGSSTKEYYIGGLVVQTNNTVKYFAMAEGRVRNNSGTLVYEYFITDQQGNVRVSFEDNNGTAVVRQENSYYPFGMPMNGNYIPTDANKKLYNAGSEWQDEFGGVIDYYSTFFREYDPVIGRFNSVDPKADATVELSIYHYSGNNPVNFNDPMGDITGSELLSIIAELSNSRYGGHWSGGSGRTDYFQSDLEGASIGSLLTLGFNVDGLYGHFGDEDLKQKYIARYKEIFQDKKRDFRFVSGTLDTKGQVYKDLNQLAGNSFGAALLALLDVASDFTNAKINISTTVQYIISVTYEPGATTAYTYNKTGKLAYIDLKYFPGLQKIEGVWYNSVRTLAHELWHAIDFYSKSGGMTNFMLGYSPAGHPSRDKSQGKFGNPERLYHEIRAVAFDNLIANGSVAPHPGVIFSTYRISYGGIPIWDWLKQISFSTY
jgi:RHS repeat-associated protein